MGHLADDLRVGRFIFGGGDFLQVMFRRNIHLLRAGMVHAVGIAILFEWHAQLDADEFFAHWYLGLVGRKSENF